MYGKVLVDFKSTVRGPFSELVMRGNMNLLSSTDVTYVMTDSPLSVQDAPQWIGYLYQLQ